MDPEFQRLVDAAAEVAATGRWDAINERIKNLAANPGRDNAWHVQLLQGPPSGYQQGGLHF
jgi:hypothetical protein